RGRGAGPFARAVARTGAHDRGRRGALAVHADEDPAVLRRNVTSPNGTTAAGLAVLMDDDAGLTPLMVRTVAAATERGRELGRG
ncbi:Pyrroline-5-carboxylate reductase, partial [marine sediment metagenome]